MTEIRERVKFLEQLQPYFADEAAYGRMHADVHDLIEASEWFLGLLDRAQSKAFDAEQAEDFLIELEVQYVDHALFHLRSLKKGIAALLANFPDDAGKE